MPKCWVLGIPCRGWEDVPTMYDLTRNEGVSGMVWGPVYRYAFINCDTGSSVYGWSCKWVG